MTSTRLYAYGVAIIVSAVILGLIGPLATLTRHVSFDPNEGWNALFTTIALRQGDLYPAPDRLIFNNYPPLSFYIIGLLGRWTGDNIIAGRIVAMTSLLIVIVNVYYWLRTIGSLSRTAYLGAGLVGGLALTYGRGYAGINDPQWLAHALMTTGMLVIWRDHVRVRSIGLGALLMLSGGLTKQLLIPIPVATTYWLMRKSRDAATVWLGCAAGLLLLISLLAWKFFGIAFFESLASARENSLRRALMGMCYALKCMSPIIVPSIASLMFPRGGEGFTFARTYFVASALVATIAAGGNGVDVNAFFDLMISASICTALAVEECSRYQLPGPLRQLNAGAVLTLLLGIYVATYSVVTVSKSIRNLQGLDTLERETLTMTTLIAREGHGRAACETPALCYWSQNNFVLDFFNYGQRLAVGRTRPAECVALFDGTHIPLVQLTANKAGQGTPQFPNVCNDAIARHYRVVYVSSLGTIANTV